MTVHSAYLKRREALVLGLEATPGVTAAQQYAFRWSNKGIKTVPGILENESAMGNDNRVNDSVIDVSHAEGPLGGQATETGLGYLNRGLFTKVTTTVVTAGVKWKHRFEYDSSVVPKSFSIWDVRPSTTRLFKSMYFDNLELNVEAGENGAWLDASTAVKGWKHENVAAVTPVFVVDETEFTSRNVKVYLAANVAGLADLTASRVKPRSIKLQLEQPKTVEHSLGDGDQPELDKGPFEAKGEMVIRYKKTDFEDNYFINAIHAMKIVIENEGDIIEYLATKVRFREMTDSDDKDTVVTQQISFYCESDAANGGHAIVSDVTNGVASYA